MKQLKLFACLALLLLGACTGKKSSPDLVNMEQNDSLQRIIAQRDSEINDMMSTLNEIQEGLSAINQAENRLSIAREGEGANKTALIKENIKFIANTMARNRELMKRLQQQLRESRFNGDELRKTISNLTQQLDDKAQELQRLKAELDAKDIHIAELDEKIDNLNDNVENLQTDAQQKAQTISNQDKQLNTAWFVFGTKKELKEQHIMENGKVLQSNFNKNYFAKIDIRIDKEIKFYSKSARILTMHPSGSYTLTPDVNKQYVLRITNPQLFWSTSKYLVVLVK
jgi:chromosome segregation ATPase